MDWKTTYPSVATVMEANLQTLQTWQGNLPAPQRDVEVTVLRRINQQIHKLAGEALRAADPALADRWNEAMDQFDKLMGKGRTWRA